MRRGARVAALLISFLLTLQIALAIPVLTIDPDTAAGQGATGPSLASGVVFIEVLPFPRAGGLETEYFTLHNPSTYQKDVSGWRICDHTDCLELEEGAYIEACAGLTVALNGSIFRSMTGTSPDRAYDERAGLNGTWPVLANDGDFLYLEDRSGMVVDVVVFGRPYQGVGWSGGLGPLPKEGWKIVRDHVIGVDGGISYLDTDTHADWPMKRARRGGHLAFDDHAHFETLMEILPLRFPEDGAVLASVVDGASKEILLNTYEFTSYSMAEVLARAASNGTEVKVLLEEDPVGGMKDRERAVIGILSDAGCSVRLIGSDVDAGRPGGFGYDHAKYLVLDGNVTVVMSENLVPAALNTSTSDTANRGWGVALLDDEVATYYRDLFLTDWGSNMAIGVDGLDIPNELGPPAERDLEIGEWPIGLMWRTHARIVPLVSPDLSEDIIISIIEGAVERLYLEVLTCDLIWDHVGTIESNPLLDAAIGAARRGVEVRVLLDSSFSSTSENGEVAMYLNELATAEGLDLEARLADIPDVTLVHNKGMVVDGMVVVSSMNWVDNAFRDNREVGIAIEAAELADLYAYRFYEDWAPNNSVEGDRPTYGPVVQDGDDVYAICGILLVLGAISLIALGYRLSRRKI